MAERLRSLDCYLKRRVSRFAAAAALFDGRRRYIVAPLLWMCYVTGSVPPHGTIAAVLLYPRFFLCAPDLYLNVRGLFGRRQDDRTDGAVAVDEMDHDFTEFNTALRPYFVIIAAIFGTVFIGAGLFTGAFDVRWLLWAIAMAALGVSMYLKDLDPKLAVLEPKAYEAVYAVAVARSAQSRR
jgi:hypothetical protein